METILEHPDAEVKIIDLDNGKRRIIVNPHKKWLAEKDRDYETNYPLDLIKKVFEVKGAMGLNDTIRREEDPLSTKSCVEYDLLAYAPPEDFNNKRILDFGCGAGASTFILKRLLPETEVVGIDLQKKNIDLANARLDFYNYEKVSFYCSPDEKTLPENIGKFDFIVLSAVYEHLLPDERVPVLQQIWSLLNPSGIFFLNQTPYRYFPFEGHTTHLFFLNYLPDKIAHAYACKFSKKVGKNQNWNGLLRLGIRGGSPREITGNLKRIAPAFKPVILKPTQLGFHDRIDVWYSGYAVSIAYKYPKVKNIQRVLKYIAKFIYYVSGIVFLPTVSLAIKKVPKDQ